MKNLAEAKLILYKVPCYGESNKLLSSLQNIILSPTCESIYIYKKEVGSIYRTTSCCSPTAV